MSSNANVQNRSHTRSLLLSWLALITLTLTSWWFSDHGLGPAAAVALILILTFVKVFMVGHSFMEIRFAPTRLRFIFSTWCAGICTLLIILALTLGTR